MGVVGSKSRRDVHNAGSVLCCDIIACYHAEGHIAKLYVALLAVFALKDLVRMLGSIVVDKGGGVLANLLAGFHPRHELLILYADELTACISAHYTVRNDLVAVAVVFHRPVLALGRQIGGEALFCHDDSYGRIVVGVVCLYGHIFKCRPYAQCCV